MLSAAAAENDASTGGSLTLRQALQDRKPTVRFGSFRFKPRSLNPGSGSYRFRFIPVPVHFFFYCVFFDFFI